MRCLVLCVLVLCVRCIVARRDNINDETASATRPYGGYLRVCLDV